MSSGVPCRHRGMNTILDHDTRELARRANDGVDVRLLWAPRSNSVFVAVDNAREGEAFVVEVDPADALDAFHHPYVYADELTVLHAVGV
jgi:hypothetical protein